MDGAAARSAPAPAGSSLHRPAAAAAPAAKPGMHLALQPDPRFVPMRSTELRSSTLMQSQDRNNYNRIFGGYILRVATEHAFATAAIFAGEYCEPMSMEDVAFRAPVHIGSILQLLGKVVYTRGNVLYIFVEATMVVPGTEVSPVLTNSFSYAFICPSKPVPTVIPETAHDIAQYVQGYRQHTADKQRAPPLKWLDISKL